MSGLSPTAWAALTAASVVIAGRPRPHVRRPGAPAEHAPPPTKPAGARAARWARRRPSPAAEATALARWCEGVARSLRSGASLGVAIGESAVPDDGALRDETRDALRAAAAAVQRGDRPQRGGSAELALVVSVLSACADNGGPAAEPLDRAAAVLRGRAHEAGERATQSAQARLSAQVMTLLPVAMLAMLVVTSASVRAALTTPPGLVAVAVGVLLNVIGWRWQRHLLRRAAA